MTRFAGLLLAASALLSGASAASAQSLVERDTYRGLAADKRAYRVGDKLTVLITENASASSTARTTTDKSGKLGATASAGVNGDTNVAAAAADLTEDFRGGGKIERTGRLLAQITVTVEAIEGDGNLRVKGEQEITLNEEKQWIGLEGLVRQTDVRSDNTVLSNRLAQAKIRYTGNGLLAEKQRPGILTRFLSWLRIL
jgi:flagellar L-ring protein precursor FlgH